MSTHQLQRSPIRFKGRADPSHIYLNSDRDRTASASASCRRSCASSELEAERAAALVAAPDEAMAQKITSLQRVRGIGANFSAVL